ncbi:hypothetical protein E3P81_02737 [Wallemia ichthyophaga]|uniref:Uncharacterized protein n=1 Tax=Wallemia ichthyophaga TaxID=245174 RepID=A0A4T0FNB4_WALIC|nr:hypothetical protein E3P97_02808 [Wallemia ichthyophaga]TIB30982.1 hypothetical protein E3P85_02462 [Wallemia ichthyophaga]TIB39250.1 hypothetical protein E3P86_01205 [Wallemia ichthyophaga]TIB45572.1 hypothetical protein E3P82_02737 [Wallemia ichthyophaga]TIB48867.1 hypothetical protein E3P81_02737 [Wallemia ichthyophaga]
MQLPTDHDAQTSSYPNHPNFPTYPGKTLVHGRATHTAKQAAKYKRAYLIIRERWNETQHETVEIKENIRKAQSALQEVEDENDVLLEALLKHQPGLGQSSLFDGGQLEQQQQQQLPPQPQTQSPQHPLHPQQSIKQEDPHYLQNQDIYKQQQQHELALMGSTTHPHQHLHQIQDSIQIQPTLSTSKRSIDDIISSNDNDNQYLKRQRF